MIPTVERPEIPTGYGISSTGEGLLGWDQIAGVIQRAKLYWISTVGNGKPHLIPLHAASTGDRIYLSGDPGSRWVKNLETTPDVQIGVADGSIEIMFRGQANRRLPDAELFSSISANIKSKYDWSFDEPVEFWEVTPRTVLAFDESEFATSPTRFTFQESR